MKLFKNKTLAGLMLAVGLMGAPLAPAMAQNAEPANPLDGHQRSRQGAGTGITVRHPPVVRAELAQQVPA